jgi:hypothetical protein
MNQTLDEKLVKKYPKIFRDRYAPMNRTAMCWGFAHGDGWYNIIDAVCRNIQGHINHNRQERARVLRYNRLLKRAAKGDVLPLQLYFTYNPDSTEPSRYAIERVEKILSEPEPQYKTVPSACSQVVAVQVKEKYGTLRFYYDGGDDFIYGIVQMAESMSEVTCEACGNPGKLRNGGWIQTLCDVHAEEAGKSEEMD